MDLIRSWPPLLFARTHAHTSPYSISKGKHTFPFRLMIYWGATSLYSSKLLCSRYATLSQLLCVRLHICTFLPNATHSAIDHRLLCHISPHIRSEGCSLGQLLFLRLFCNASHFHKLFYASEFPLCSLEWCPIQKHREENITKPTMILPTCSLQIRSVFLMISTVTLMHSITQQWQFVLKTALVFGMQVMILVYIIIYFVLL